MIDFLNNQIRTNKEKHIRVNMNVKLHSWCAPIKHNPLVYFQSQWAAWESIAVMGAIKTNEWQHEELL